MDRLSVIIICRDEAQQIKACLESISWADEIIVVDSGSTDGTREIAETFTPHVHDVPWKGFGPQKNHALSLATGDWVLSIDADERAERGMEQEVRHLMHKREHVGYEVPRCNWYCGRKIRFGDWGGDQVLRLFQRAHGRFTDDAVHERIIVDGSIGNLRTPLEHHTIRTLEQHRDKIRYYTELTTRLGQESGKRSSRPRQPSMAAGPFCVATSSRVGFSMDQPASMSPPVRPNPSGGATRPSPEGHRPATLRRVEVQSSVADGSPSMVNRAGWPNQLLMLASPYLSLRTFTTSFMSASESTHPL